LNRSQATAELLLHRWQRHTDTAEAIEEQKCG
jgi:hypothetical protein